jgi:hypothetical protein
MTRRKSAYSAALEVAQQDSQTVLPSEGKTEGKQREATPRRQEEPAVPHYPDQEQQKDRQTVFPSNGRKDYPEKITFYLTTQQAEKLDDLAHDFRKRHHKRINRNDIIRHLIDQCTLNSLDTLPSDSKTV